ncbi:MAG: DUF2244 domain-containing protein [Pseudomonadota bacterium]
MITSSRDQQRLTIVARPDQSSTWRTNQLVLLALAVPSLLAATIFALLGAWPILPLAGLELTALGSALYYVQCKLQARQVITVSSDSVTIDKGYRFPQRRWRFPRSATGLTITPQAHALGKPTLHLHDRHDTVTLGEFLNRDDSEALIALLRQEIRVRGESRQLQRDF